MPASDFDADEPIPFAPLVDWNPGGETPAALRDYWKVYNAAEPVPDHLAGTYDWASARGEWDGVNPPLGVLPPELLADMKFVCGRTVGFATCGGARAALQVAVLRWENGSWQKKRVRKGGAH